MMLGEEIPRRSYCEGKVVLLSLLLGGAALLSLAQIPHEADVATDMIAVAPTGVKKQLLQPARAWQPPRAGHFMQPKFTASALPSQSEPLDAEDSSRREVVSRISKLAGAFALAGAGLKDQPALAGVETVPAVRKKSDSRFKALLLAPATAVTWVLFNIAGPGLNQLDEMSDVAKAREGAAAPKRAAPKKAAPPKKAAAAPKKKSGLFR
jgi:hypothetical protein